MHTFLLNISRLTFVVTFLVLGGQEQAADQVAVMLLIMADGSNRQDINPVILNKLLAISDEWMLEWQKEKKRITRLPIGILTH